MASKAIFPNVFYQARKGDVVLTPNGITFYSDVDWPKPSTTLQWSEVTKVTANVNSASSSPKLRVTEIKSINDNTTRATAHFFIFQTREELERARSEMNSYLEDENLGDKATSKRAPMPPTSVESNVTSTTIESTGHLSHTVHVTARGKKNSRRRSRGEIGSKGEISHRRHSCPPTGKPPPPPSDFSISTGAGRRHSGTGRASEHSKSKEKLPSFVSADSTNWKAVPNFDTFTNSPSENEASRVRKVPSVFSAESTNWGTVLTTDVPSTGSAAGESVAPNVRGSETRSTTAISRQKVVPRVHHRRHSATTKSTMGHNINGSSPSPMVQSFRLDISQPQTDKEAPLSVHITPVSPLHSQEEWRQGLSLGPDAGGRRIHRVYDEVIEIDPEEVTKVTPDHEKMVSKDPEKDESCWIFKTKEAFMEWVVVTVCCCLLMVGIILLVYFLVKEEEESSADKARKNFYANAFDAYWI